MAYSASNPPKLLAPSMGSGQPALWVYRSSDAHAAVSASDYFAEGEELGMKVGDFVMVQDSDNGASTLHSVSGIDSDGNVTVAAAVLA